MQIWKRHLYELHNKNKYLGRFFRSLEDMCRDCLWCFVLVWVPPRVDPEDGVGMCYLGIQVAQWGSGKEEKPIKGCDHKPVPTVDTRAQSHWGPTERAGWTCVRVFPLRGEAGAFFYQLLSITGYRAPGGTPSYLCMLWTWPEKDLGQWDTGA